MQCTHVNLCDRYEQRASYTTREYYTMEKYMFIMHMQFKDGKGEANYLPLFQFILSTFVPAITECLLANTC